MGDVAGIIGLTCGLLVAPVQLIRILRTKEVSGISLLCYILLVLTVAGYFIHALFIGDLIFSLANGISILSNSLVVFLLVRYRK